MGRGVRRGEDAIDHQTVPESVRYSRRQEKPVGQSRDCLEPSDLASVAIPSRVPRRAEMRPITVKRRSGSCFVRADRIKCIFE